MPTPVPELRFRTTQAAYDALKAYGLMYPSPQNGLVAIHPTAGIINAFLGQMVSPAVNSTSSSAITAARVALQSAQASLDNIVFAALESWAFQFEVDCTTPSSIAHGTSGTTPFSITVFDPGYSLTITLTLFDISGTGSGITGAFSPATFTGSGSGTLTITVPGGVTPGSYDLMVEGRDGDDINNRAFITLVVT